MDGDYLMVESDGDGVFEDEWPEPLGRATPALSAAMALLAREEQARCGARGRAKVALAKTEFGLWVAAYFLAGAPTGGSAMLLAADLSEPVGSPAGFGFDLDADPGAEELCAALLNDVDAFDFVYRAMSGREPPEAE